MLIMEDNRILKSAKNFVIGDFNVSMQKKDSSICVEIPFAGMAFYHPGERKADFRLLIDEREKDGSGEMLWGSDEFAVPTFVYERGTGYFEWKTKQKGREPGLSFRISPDWTEFVLYQDFTGTNGERAFHEFGSLFSYAVLNHHAAVFHGVVMEYKGMGILVMASSGTGKTTHTRMWRDIENALILNGDRCLCRKVTGRWYAYGMPWSGSSGEYINRKVPISVIVSLKRDCYNHVEEMGLYDRTLFLMQRIFAPVWKGHLQECAFDLCDEAAREIRMLELYCRPDPDSVETLKRAVLRL